MSFVIKMMLILAHSFHKRPFHNSCMIITHYKAFNNVKSGILLVQNMDGL